MIDKETFSNSDDFIDNDQIDFRGVFENYLFYWKWFLICLIISISISYTYLLFADKQYEVITTIFIDDKDSGGIASELAAFEDLGTLKSGSKKTVINEIGVLKSLSLMTKVVEDLDLNIRYFVLGKLKDRELYGINNPIRLISENPSHIYKNAIFYLILKSKEEFQLLDEDRKLINEGKFGDVLSTRLGKIRFMKIGETDLGEIKIVISSVLNTAKLYRNKLWIEPERTKSSLLLLGLRDNVKRRAADILDQLVLTYNNDAIDYKTLITENTDKFINERIFDISIDLENVDKGIEEFKTKNELTDIEYEASLNLETNTILENSIVELNSQIRLINYIQEYMVKNENGLIPENLGLKDASTSDNTKIYNQLLLERNRIMKGSSSLNPTIINLNSQIETIRTSILQSLINLKSSLNNSLNDARIQESRLQKKRINAPKQEREFQDIKRKQIIVETLYLYLLKKREENAISIGIPVPNAKIVDKANGANSPVSPKPLVIYILGVMGGLFFPISIIFIKSLMDNNIYTTEDLDKEFDAPILGDVPKIKLKTKFLVKENDNSSIAEAYRLIRTNLSFMFSEISKGKSKTILFTSTIGGEGKTFSALNLASSITSLDKTVLIIGADLRKPKLSKYLNIKPKKGITDFIKDTNVSSNEIIYSSSEYNFDVAFAGQIPPNPTSLLLSNRFEEFIKYANDTYDYVLIDSPPISLVTDTLIISKWADLIIYIVRANYLDKRLLKGTRKIYKSNRLKNLALILNQTDIKKKGYGYGYGYGN